MIDVDEVVLEHVNRLGQDIWRLETDAEERLSHVCTAATLLIFNQCKNLDREAYKTYMNVVFGILRTGAWILWEKAHQRRRT